MSLFSASRAQGTTFLRQVEQRLHLTEFERLRQEGGFTPPNDFPVDALIDVLRAHEFPKTDLYEFQWAIQECEFERLATYSPWMKLYLSALYVYCNKRHLWGSQIESDYYYLVVTSAMADPQSEVSAAFLSFIEWLIDRVSPASGYDDYFALLAWTLLRRLRNETAHPQFQGVVERLLAKNYARDDLELLTVSVRDIDVWWHDLHERIPCPESLKLTFALLMGR